MINILHYFKKIFANLTGSVLIFIFLIRNILELFFKKGKFVSYMYFLLREVSLHMVWSFYAHI